MTTSHNVPRWDIENNFFGNLAMLDEHFQMLDHLQVVDTSEFLPKPLAAFNGTNCLSSVPVADLPLWFTTNLPSITTQIKAKDLGGLADI